MDKDTGIRRDSGAGQNSALEYSEDQCLNIGVFSCLYQWLYSVYHLGTITRVDVHTSSVISHGGHGGPGAAPSNLDETNSAVNGFNDHGGPGRGNINDIANMNNQKNNTNLDRGQPVLQKTLPDIQCFYSQKYPFFSLFLKKKKYYFEKRQKILVILMFPAILILMHKKVQLY